MSTRKLWFWVLPEEPAKPATFPKEIVREIASKHGLTMDEILTETKAHRIAHARQEAMYELRQRTSLSLPAIARRLNLLDHSTVHYGLRAHEERLNGLRPRDWRYAPRGAEAA